MSSGELFTHHSLLITVLEYAIEPRLPRPFHALGLHAQS